MNKGHITELSRNWRPLAAGTFGFATGLSSVGMVMSTIGPHLARGNGWTDADFAIVAGLTILCAFSFPFVGRLADVIGVRWTALIGLVALPLIFLGYSQMDGSLSTYMMLYAVQCLICVTTTATVYTRLAAQYVSKARGLAMAIVASGPAISGAIGAPFLNAFVEANGWRAAFLAVSIFLAISGVVTFLLIPPEPKGGAKAETPRRKAREDYPAIFRARAFWLFVPAMLLCNLTQVLSLTQIKALVLANGISGSGAGAMISAASIGMLFGRIVTGLALDRFDSYRVSFLMLGLPSLGLFLIASSFDAPFILMLSVFLIGFANGAEGDLVGFLVARHFGITIYSSVMGLLTAVMAISTTIGAILLGRLLKATGGYEAFLIAAGVAVILGASLLLKLKREPVEVG